MHDRDENVSMNRKKSKCMNTELYVYECYAAEVSRLTDACNLWDAM